MTVYVDEPRNKFGRMVMCHMIADTLDELHIMAAKIGMHREWFQNNADHPHYDVSKSKRVLAVRYGAVEVDNRQLIMIIRKQRSKRNGKSRSKPK